MTDKEKKEAAEKLANDVTNLQTSATHYEKNHKDKKYVETHDFQVKIDNFKKERDDEKKKQDDDIKFKFGEITDQLKEVLEFQKKYTTAPPATSKEEKIDKIKAFGNVAKFTGLLDNRHSNMAHDVKEYPTEDELKSILGVDVEGKAMTTEALARAGALVPPGEFMAGIIDQAIVQVSPIRQHAFVMSTTLDSVSKAAFTAHGLAQWLYGSEVGTRSKDTTATFGQEDIILHQAYGYYDVSRNLLQDSAFNLEQMLQKDYALGKAKLEGTAHIAGSGIGEPEGLTTGGRLTATVGGHATLLNNPDKLKKIYFDLKSEYRANAKYFCNSATAYEICVLADGVGNYMLKPLWDDHGNIVIMGKQLVTMEDFADIAANAYVMVFGDMYQTYTILDKTGDESLLVDPYTLKSTGIVEYMLSWRTGGAVTNPEASRTLKIST